MKQRMKQLILSTCAFILFGNMQLAAADTASDTETLLNWAQNTYPHLFPGAKTTQSIEPWLYRYYPETQIYVGVKKSDNSVYVLGDPWGDDPTLIDTLPNLITQITDSGGHGGIAACDMSNVPAGIAYSQSGNVVTVTSNGQCVPAPDLTNTNLCSAPKQTTASGVSLLGSNTVTTSKIEGLKINIPGLPDPIKGIVDASANVKHCTMNAASEAANLVVNSDFCFDITSAITGLLAGLPVDMTPPVKYFTAGTYKSETVADCFTTEATTVSDAFTGEIWVRKNGVFEKINN